MAIPTDKSKPLEIDYESLGKRYEFGELCLFVDEKAVMITIPIKGDIDQFDVRVSTTKERLLLEVGDLPHFIKKDIPIPARIDEENTVATYVNGVLDVVMPLYKEKR